MNYRPNYGVPQPIVVGDADYNKQIKKNSLYYANIIVWTVMFLYPLVGILDFVYANQIFQELFLVKIITVVLIYVVYDLCRRAGASIDITLHATFFLIAANAAIVCNIVSFEVAPVFFLIYSSLFMLFNLAVFWAPINSFAQLLSTLILLSIGYQIFNEVSLETYLAQGAGLFIMTGFFSCFIPLARFSIIRKNTLNGLKIQNTTTQLYALHLELVDKNNQIEHSNAKLGELVVQQDTFLALVRSDIQRFVIALKDLAGRVKSAGSINDGQNEYVEELSQNINSLQQLTEIFPDHQNAPVSDIQINLASVDVYQRIQAMVVLLKPELDQRKMVFQWIKSSDRALVPLDRLYFDQIIYNLFANMFKHAGNKNEIFAEILKNKHTIELVISCAPNAMNFAVQKESVKSKNPTVQSLKQGLGPGFYVARLLTEKMGGELFYDQGLQHVSYILKFKSEIA
ncbi:hypothetical protein [Pedobacter sp. Leaf250]|uniref:hypothetical protein n=1 Tax=Pedobacter sp. Leaf250 TaxID=2876559 RepID=UPI001E470E25|nr:hypothetical protein [Pedobacter sp. Leaf250]